MGIFLQLHQPKMLFFVGRLVACVPSSIHWPRGLPDVLKVVFKGRAFSCLLCTSAMACFEVSRSEQPFWRGLCLFDRTAVFVVLFRSPVAINLLPGRTIYTYPVFSKYFGILMKLFLSPCSWGIPFIFSPLKVCTYVGLVLIISAASRALEL